MMVLCNLRALKELGPCISFYEGTQLITLMDAAETFDVT